MTLWIWQTHGCRMNHVLQTVALVWTLAAVTSSVAQTCPQPLPPTTFLEHPSHPIVRLCLNEGPIDIELFTTTAPNTVANFLNYVTQNAYDGAVFHRLDDNFVLQGGGYTFSDSAGFVPIPTNPPIQNEFNRSNLQRTVAMARVGGQPHSATNQFYINLSHNTFLDTVDGGFTVFGRILGEDSWTIIDNINLYPTINLGAPFNELPVRPGFTPPLDSQEVLRFRVVCFAPACCPTPEITQQPSDTTVNNGGVATFAVGSSSPTPVVYQWRRNGEPFSDGVTRHGSIVSGSTTASLTIVGVRSLDAADYECLLSNECGLATTRSASLTVACTADFNSNGIVDVPDIFAFLTVWFAGNYPAADFNNDQSINVHDIFAFLQAWFLGCP